MEVVQKIGMVSHKLDAKDFMMAVVSRQEMDTKYAGTACWILSIESRLNEVMKEYNLEEVVQPSFHAVRSKRGQS